MTELKDIINSMVDRLNTFATEVERVSLEVGTEGKLGGQAVVEGVEGTWRELTNVVNRLAANLTSQVRSIAKVTKAVARGDLSETITVDAKGEVAELATTVNGMVSGRVRQRRLTLPGHVTTIACWRSQSSVTGSRFSRQTRWSGLCARCGGRVERPNSQCEQHRLEDSSDPRSIECVTPSPLKCDLSVV